MEERRLVELGLVRQPLEGLRMGGEPLALTGVELRWPRIPSIPEPMTGNPHSAVVPAVRRPQTRRILALTIALLALSAAILWFGAGNFASITGVDVPWWAMAIGFATAGMLAFNFEIHREAHVFTFSEVPLVLGLVFAGPLALVVGRVVGETGVLAIQERQGPVKLAFNLSICIAECSVALFVFSALVGDATLNDPRAWLATIVAVVAADVVSISAVGLAIHWHGARAEPSRLLLTGSVTAIANTSLALAAALLLWTNVAAVSLLVVVAAVLFVVYRSYTALAQRYASLSLFYDFTTSVADSLRAERVLETILDKARELLRSDYAEIRVVDGEHDGRVLHVSARADAPLVADSRSELESTEWLRAEVIERRDVAILRRTTRETRERDLLDQLGTRDAMVAPLLGKAGVIGTITVGDRLGEVSTFDGDAARLFRTLANHASVALENGRLIEQLSREVREREFQALHDALTGLPNRSQFLEQVAAVIDRPSGASFAVLLTDLDGFKDVNDTLGHDSGDLLLQEVARRLPEEVPATAMVARLGSDEFAVLLPDSAREIDAIEIARGVRTVLGQPYEIEGMTLESSGSVGIAMWPEHAADVNALMKCADVAMYTAKGSSAGIEAYHPDRDSHSLKRLSLASQLRRAIEEHELLVYYQPKARLSDGEIVAAEALVRWRHPEHGMIPPDEFVAIAERTGLIGDLTTFVLHAALEQCSRWRRSGRELSVAVNLSVRNLFDLDLPSQIGRILNAVGADPRWLTLEVTESTVMDPRRGIAALERLSGMGVQLAIDDFGTGYSSLSYLQRLPVHELKVDKSFVMGMGVDENNISIVRTIVDLGHNLGLRVVAEGVEDQIAWDTLRSMGCDVAQGYYLSRPIPAPKLDRWLGERQPVSPRPALAEPTRLARLG
ncbi:MAG: putative bifunctional diguanylate cyclase/phosphodiesterase [Acidimicrobiia bacterium]